MVRDKAHLGAAVPADGVSDGRAFIVEALITFLLVFVIMAVTTDTRVPAALAAPSIALVAAVLIGGGVTGGAVNPDRALGPALMSGTYTSLWVYVSADILGGIIAALLYTHVVGKATAPTMAAGDPQAARPAGDRGPATAATPPDPPPEATPLRTTPGGPRPTAEHPGPAATLDEPLPIARGADSSHPANPTARRD